MKQLVIGVLAHVDAGKTTLSEAMLYRAGAIRKLGRVDHGDAFLDTDSLEKARGITIFSKQALLTAGNTDITLLDTPGHVDFSTETERTLQVLDYAVLVVSGTDGVQSHTETLWRLLRRYHVPTFVFVNKMDLPGKSREELLAQLNHRLGEGFVAFDVPQADRDEALALCDENLRWLKAVLAQTEPTHVGSVGHADRKAGLSARPDAGDGGPDAGAGDPVGHLWQAQQKGPPPPPAVPAQGFHPGTL